MLANLLGGGLYHVHFFKRPVRTDCEEQSGRAIDGLSISLRRSSNAMELQALEETVSVRLEWFGRSALPIVVPRLLADARFDRLGKPLQFLQLLSVGVITGPGFAQHLQLTLHLGEQPRFLLFESGNLRFFTCRLLLQHRRGCGRCRAGSKNHAPQQPEAASVASAAARSGTSVDHGLTHLRPDAPPPACRRHLETRQNLLCCSRHGSRRHAFRPAACTLRRPPRPATSRRSHR